MRTEQELLINQLLDLTQKAHGTVQQFKDLSDEELNLKPEDGGWSILECLEHLNLYGRFYLPEIEKQLLQARSVPTSNMFRSSLIGDFFVNSIKAGNGKKMKAVKPMDSTGMKLNAKVLDQFIKQLDLLISLLHKCKKVDLNRTRTAISLTKLIRLRLGDTLRFLVHHNERHILQAKRIEAKVRAKLTS